MMKTYTIYRAVFADSIEDIDFDNLGQSFAISEFDAINFADQWNDRGNYFMIEAEVTEAQINIAQTNAQWDSKDWGNEGEVVLTEHQEINITVYGEKKIANTGFCRYENDETRPNPIECAPFAVTDFLNLTL